MYKLLENKIWVPLPHLEPGVVDSLQDMHTTYLILKIWYWNFFQNRSILIEKKMCSVLA